VPTPQAKILGLALVGAVAAVLPAFAQDAGGEFVAQMRDAGFSNAQIAEARAGGIVTRILPQREDNAAFVTGVARIAAPAEAFAEGIRHIESLRSGGRMLQIGRFRMPPTTEDLQALVVEARDLDDLRRCRVGDCDVQIGRHAMELLHAVDWKADDARERAAERTKEILVAQVKAYLNEGSAAMAIYDDNDTPESVRSALEQILATSPGVVRDNPAFYRYFLEFPGSARPPDVEDIFYWSKEQVRKPVTSLVHVCLQRVEENGRASYCVAMKHIYDSHYFLGYAEFLKALPEPGGAGGFYLVRSIRALIDPPRGWLRGLLLGKIKKAMRDALAQDLQRTKSRLELARPRMPPG
jgi:hypothetical protein